MVVDVRSDTVTRPTPGMLAAMMQARVGDDVLGEDETVNLLQARAAAMFGKEAALFCPSGTMTNQIGIRLHTQPGDEVICDQLAHIYLYEGGGIAANASCSVRLLAGDRGRFTAEAVAENVNGRHDSHLPWTRLVAIENSVNKGGGAVWSLAEIRRIRAVCDREGLALHLDGARLFNALAATGESPLEYGALFDTVSVCLSKGLGAPAGSLLLGTQAQVAKAHRLRKVMGGGMRQAGYLAAAGLYAFDHHLARLADDHRRAREVGRELAGLASVAAVLPVDTNIVLFTPADGVSTEGLLAYLREKGVQAGTLGKRLVRFVLHLDVDDAGVDALIAAMRAYR
jgi:threonine aldolase